MILDEIQILQEFGTVSILFKIGLALLLGGMLGFERETRQRAAGFRTYVIVCLGATLACTTNIFLANRVGTTDIARIPAQVISGVGFLGAGTILVTRNNRITGLTTAAGLWCCATIGIAVGSGFYFGATISTIAMVFALKCLSVVDKAAVKHSKYIHIYAECDYKEFLKDVSRYARTNGYKITDLELFPSNNSDYQCCMFTLQVKNNSQRETALRDIAELESCAIMEELAL